MPDTNGTATLANATPRAKTGDKIVRRRQQAHVERADGKRVPLRSGNDLQRMYRKGFTRLVLTTYDVPSGKVVREVNRCLDCDGVTYGNDD